MINWMIEWLCLFRLWEAGSYVDGQSESWYTEASRDINANHCLNGTNWILYQVGFPIFGSSKFRKEKIGFVQTNFLFIGISSSNF